MFFIVISIGVVQNFRDFPKFPKKWETFSEKKIRGKFPEKKIPEFRNFRKFGKTPEKFL